MVSKISNQLFLNTALAAVLVLVFGADSFSQPLSDNEETLLVESQIVEIAVPSQIELSGGHLQGVQLFNGTLVVSGSSNKYGYLALFQLLKGDFRYLGIKKLAGKPLNHAGGFQVAENWLAVGLENTKSKSTSVVQIIDVSSFENFSKPPVYTLERKGEAKRSTAGAVALLKRNDHFLLAVGSWGSSVIDFYKSNHTDPNKEDFDFELWTSWDSREAKRKEWTSKPYGSYQSLQLSEDSTGVYITGFARLDNSNVADVFKLTTDADPYTLIQKVASYKVQCSGDITFRNGAGFTDFSGISSIVTVGHKLTPTTRIQISPIKKR